MAQEDEDSAEAGPGVRVVGKPLPGHTIVLRLASERFKTQVERWSAGESAGAEPSSKRRATVALPENGDAGGPQAARASSRQPPLLQLRVPLGSEEELPAALSVIKFAYTGHIEAGSIEEALQARQQADYLQMEGCVAACVAAVRGMLVPADDSSGDFDRDSDDEGGGGGDGTAGSRAERVLELYSCAPLWPDPEQEPAFAALLAEAKPRLVAHFGDALAVLNKQDLFEQMLALPAVGLEALLESDDFGTDSESSVVLVLAEWMAENYGSTDADTRRQLCGLLRLACCSRGYLEWVLPDLALDQHCHPDSQADWLPITLEQARCVAAYAAATSDDDRTTLKEVLDAAWSRSGSGRDNSPPAAWLSSAPRRQCVPREGLSFSFTRSKDELVECLGDLGSGEIEYLYFDVEDAPHAGICVAAMGLHWSPCIRYQQGQSAAGMWLGLKLPWAYHRPAEPQESPAPLRGADWGLARPFAQLPAEVYLHRWRGGQKEEARQEQEQQQEQGRQQAKQQRRALVAAQWADYLNSNMLTGCIKMLRPT
ncbi:hypothetical protein HXX76_003142 [Chlamydomonas incerta]|uniref:BACK domain-containing protein n=1 Tax=Chlamydomonas incerta TaxID=51695 RepID=A0A835W6R9_CHLIN|nr:hypothetical protein HXX76_003142 [Chlamydomonas incerta]|eukprot:KAG2441520.1 hypothetical protein HXX76_003142 [Chlamydomonas incerta]